MGDEERKGPEEADGAAAQAAAEAAAKARAEAAAKAKAAKEAAEAAKPAWEREPKIPEWEEAGGDPIAAALAERHGASLLSARTLAGDLVLAVERDAIREVARSLHDEHGFTMLIDICGADYPDREGPRFEVVYHLMNLDSCRRVRLRVSTDEDSPVPSLVPLWRGANWPEREAFDMYGIGFADHPDMTRILMWEGFEGHPLRKDFPVEGIETGAAIYPEYYEEAAGPVTGTGTGWKPPRDEEGAAGAAEDA
ncbi:MAG: NADH-quinone oxidoreductase subunit C [Acidobacteriota bacterium]|nr:NADH-quinone oxidoreductase subunit C [Acidobacteriota bacterium]MDH3522428.1 NADH-quinone oxidoreductase subunit C [Acidobacteriota bacterium]